jgi:hypothetical protein
LRGGGLTNTAFTVESYLSNFFVSHGWCFLQFFCWWV